MRPRQPLGAGPGRVAALGAILLAGIGLSGLGLAGVGVSGLVLPSTAVAAPFCLQNQGMTPQCIYYDPTICQRDAQKQNAECGVNPRETRVQSGAGQYCVVTAARISVCHFQDYNSCQAEARRQNGACTGAPDRNPARPPDPYSRQGY